MPTTNTQTNLTTTVHGVFMDVLGTGVLLRGVAGIGKSELALSLINNGHRLIADDAIFFEHDADHQLVGSCPTLLQDFLEVRGLGVLNIRALFGDAAISDGKILQLIVNLLTLDDQELQIMDRLKGLHRDHTLLGIDIPEVTISVAAGRNLAVLVEVAVRNHLLKTTGYQADKEFIQRHEVFLKTTQLN